MRLSSEKVSTVFSKVKTKTIHCSLGTHGASFSYYIRLSGWSCRTTSHEILQSRWFLVLDFFFFLRIRFRRMPPLTGSSNCGCQEVLFHSRNLLIAVLSYLQISGSFKSPVRTMIWKYKGSNSCLKNIHLLLPNQAVCAKHLPWYWLPWSALIFICKFSTDSLSIPRQNSRQSCLFLT